MRGIMKRGKSVEEWQPSEGRSTSVRRCIGAETPEEKSERPLGRPHTDQGADPAMEKDSARAYAHLQQIIGR